MVRRARPIIRAATGITLAKRIILTDEIIPDVSAADFDNPLNVDLLQCIEAQDEEQVSDGTTIADAPLYSRIAAMRVNLFTSASAGTLIRWLLYKMPDGESLISSLADANFHGSNDTPTQREMRKMTVAKGYYRISPDRLQTDMKIRVSRAAWKRISPLRENDTLRLVIAKSAEGSTGLLSGMGTIWVKANA